MIRFPPAALPASAAELRAAVRAFLEAHCPPERRHPIDGWSYADPGFSCALGAQGWLGMTWPRRYGGHERSQLERYVVVEELLAAGAPVGAHWVADRQTGPLLLRHGSEAQRARFLPEIARGECFFAIGMSEADSGSDLASVRTRARPVDGGWRLSGAKLWTSFAQVCQFILVLCRTAPAGEDRHAGLTQLIVPLDADGVTIRAIENLAGEAHFNEVVFDDVFVPDDLVVGEPGAGWRQVMAELAFERSGPERLLSTLALLPALVAVAGDDAARQRLVGELVAELQVLRAMSLSVAAALERGELPDVEAAVVKDLGTSFEQSVAERIRALLPVQPRADASTALAALVGAALLHAPTFSLRGGTREVLRGVIARGLGLR